MLRYARECTVSLPTDESQFRRYTESASIHHRVAEGRVTVDELAALGAERLAGLARMCRDMNAMGRSVSVLERTVVELREDVTLLGQRVDRLEPRIDGIAVRLERIELQLDGAAR